MNRKFIKTVLVVLGFFVLMVLYMPEHHRLNSVFFLSVLLFIATYRMRSRLLRLREEEDPFSSHKRRSRLPPPHDPIRSKSDPEASL